MSRERVHIKNTSRQMIPIQVKPEGGDYFHQENQVRLNPGKSIELPASFVMDVQLTNLAAKGMIKIIK